MEYTLHQNLVKTDLSALVKAIEQTEQTRDFELAKKYFSEFWEDFEIDPDFSAFESLTQAKLLRLTGYFLSNYGKAKNLKNYQERGKNLLTRAIDIYLQLNDKYQAAEAQNALALCYFYEGAIIEAEAILEQTAQDYLNDHLSLVYLQNRGNLLITKSFYRDYQEALQIIEEITVPMEFCDDVKTCVSFHQNTGIIYRRIGQYQKAIYHYHHAIKFAESIGNYLFASQAYNNLAFLYNLTRDYANAHLHADQALSLALEEEQSGWLPHFLDTKALIYASEGYYELALEMIEKAIAGFKKGDSSSGLTEAMWNKCKFLLHLNRKEEAILLFNEMLPIASQQMSGFAVQGFVKEFANLIHIKQDGSLDEEVRRFKRTEIVNAIVNAKYNLHEAADFLKINVTSLIKTLDKEFYELYDELNLIKQSKTGQDFEIVESKPAFARNISELKMDNSKFVFENEAPQKLKTFYFSAEKMFDSFGIEQDSVVVILPVDKISTDEFILVEDLSRNLYAFGKVNYDSDLDLYYLFEKDEPMPISMNEFKLIGQAFAFCPFDRIDEDQLCFQSLIF